MPVEINYLEDNKGIEFLASGTVTGRDIIDANNKVYTPEILEWLEYKLIDRTQCQKYDVKSGEIRAIAQQDIQAALIKPGLCILLVSPTQVQFGMSRMWQTFIEDADLDVRHFKTREEANVFIEQTFREPATM